MKDFCIELNDSSESLALIGEMLGAADVNIKGLCLTSYQERSIVHFIVEDADTTRRVLEDSDIRINDESEVYILNKDEKGVTGRPGSFGGICRNFAEHGIKINFAYPAENNRFVFGVDNVSKARELFG